MAAPLKALSIVDALADALRERIVSGEIGPGTLLPETDIAREYKVARPTAKAAIEKLVGEGLLRRDAHKTARVPLMTADDVLDLYFSRACIEREVMRQLAANRTVPPAAVAAVQEIIAAGETPSVAIVAPDIRFHQVLVDALGLPRLSKLYASLMGEMRLAMAQLQSYKLRRPLEIADEHQAILNRIRDGDSEGAAKAVTDHLDLARDKLATYLRADTTQLDTRGSLLPPDNQRSLEAAER